MAFIHQNSVFVCIEPEPEVGGNTKTPTRGSSVHERFVPVPEVGQVRLGLTRA